MMTDATNRDAATDLAVCAAATPGPWLAKSLKNKTGGLYATLVEPNVCGLWVGQGTGLADAEFIVTAREALPHWIQRAVDAERMVYAMLGAMQSQDDRERSAGEACGVPYAEHGCNWPAAASNAVLSLRQQLAAAMEWQEEEERA